MLRIFLTIFTISWISLGPAVLAEVVSVDEEGNQSPLRVGTMHTPPFCIKNLDGSWSGISIDLWQEIASELHIEYEFEEYTLQELLEGVSKGEFDAVVAALTVTEDRELVMDFTHPLHSTGFAIATQPRQRTNVWLSVLQQLFSWQFLQVAGFLALMLLVVGWLLCLVQPARLILNEMASLPGHSQL